MIKSISFFFVIIFTFFFASETIVEAGFLDKLKKDLEKGVQDIKNGIKKIEKPVAEPKTEKPVAEPKTEKQLVQSTDVDYMFRNAPHNGSSSEKDQLNSIENLIDLLNKELNKKNKQNIYYKLMEVSGHMQAYVLRHGESQFEELKYLEDRGTVTSIINKWKTDAQSRCSLAVVYGVIEIEKMLSNLSFDYNKSSYDHFVSFMAEIESLYQSSLADYKKGVKNNDPAPVHIAILKLEFIKPYKDVQTLYHNYTVELSASRS